MSELKSWFELYLELPRNNLVYRFMPWIYNKNVTANEAAESERLELTDLKAILRQHFENNFVKTANEDGIFDYEKLLDINPDPLTESLHFRHLRVLSLLIMRTPYTKRFLVDYLKRFFDEDDTDIIEENIKDLFFRYKAKHFNLEIYPNEYLILFNFNWESFKYTHAYLNINYTHDEMTETHNHFGQYAMTFYYDKLYEQIIKNMRNNIVPANMLINDMRGLDIWTHDWLNRNFTHDEMAMFTQWELSRQAIPA